MLIRGDGSHKEKGARAPEASVSTTSPSISNIIIVVIGANSIDIITFNIIT